jgi:hypothetical protein
MIPIIYYAHSKRIYNSEEETEELDAIRDYFFTALIFNPNRPSIQWAKDPMAECLRLVEDESTTALVFSGIDGYIEAGVYAEIRVAQNTEKAVYYLNEDQEITEFRGTCQRLPRRYAKKMKYRIYEE